jgi:hypothetical protein
MSTSKSAAGLFGGCADDSRIADWLAISVRMERTARTRDGVAADASREGDAGGETSRQGSNSTCSALLRP